MISPSYQGKHPGPPGPHDAAAYADPQSRLRANAPGIVVYNATLLIRDDGTCEVVVPGSKGSPFTGTIVVQDGQFRWTDSRTGNKGLLVLHEENGKRVLIRTGQGLDSTGTYEPAK